MTRLYRSQKDRKIGGICGGIGEMMEVDPTIVRLVFLVLCLATGILPFFVGYLVGWWIIPIGPAEETGKPG